MKACHVQLSSSSLSMIGGVQILISQQVKETCDRATEASMMLFLKKLSEAKTSDEFFTRKHQIVKSLFPSAEHNEHVIKSHSLFRQRSEIQFNSISILMDRGICECFMRI